MSDNKLDQHGTFSERYVFLINRPGSDGKFIEDSTLEITRRGRKSSSYTLTHDDVIAMLRALYPMLRPGFGGENLP